MSRPLLITDCDEVLLHMVRHMTAWLDEAHAIDFRPDGGFFTKAARRQSDGSLLADSEMWTLLDGFFRTEMTRQTLVPHAREALERIADVADIVVLTNLGEESLTGRVDQLARFGIEHRVICNGMGSKGDPVARLVAEYRPSVAVFVDDLAVHHAAVAKATPDVFRLHMIAEPEIAAQVGPAPDAHARIDDWAEAVVWVLARFQGETVAA
ncbi:HAD family hydrolase [Sphingomonas sp. BIUV-7]|uniref:HAD family hydrolase n=1 Tax=Sphingomonas natans TaxID=3063330 RepID=A0ABT8Y6B3_9SPHN|nr:HAD family hydrolase [Sphingomonas sp. BIUV-7]MDO6413861.1 HAD family hydrolase [Sphingomonas sp. BIUV-7]